METFFSKTRVLAWIIIGLVALNVATVTVIYMRMNNSQRGMAESGQMFGRQGPKRFAGRQGEFGGRAIREKLGFSDPQMDSFHLIHQHFRQRTNDISTQIHKHRQRMIELMDANVVDKQALDALSDSIGLQHSLLRKELVAYYINLRAMCNDEQKKLLLELFKTQMPGDERMNCMQRGKKTKPTMQ